MRLFLVIIFLCVRLIVSSQCSLVHKKIYVGDKEFTPLVLNYGVSIRFEGKDNHFIAPNMSYYTDGNPYNCKDEKECLEHLQRDLNLISSLGYNCIRLFDFEFGINKHGDKQDRPCTVDLSFYYKPFQYHYFEKPYEDHFSLLDKVVEAAKHASLKIMLVAGGKEIHRAPISQLYSEYLEVLSSRYRNENTIIAYDLANEPSYFHSIDDKKEIKLLVDNWCKAIRSNTNNQLITIGLTDGNTTFDWDPEFLNVDFLSFHLYPEENGSLEMYKKHVQWMSSSLSKPWMIGETGFAASNYGKHKINNGTLQDQLNFFNTTYELCRDCGALGYSWWQFHDVGWSPDYGILDSLHNLKPVAKASQSSLNYVPDFKKCNILQARSEKNVNTKKSYKGKVLKEGNKPLPYAVVVGSLGKGKFISTYANENGEFEIHSNKKIKRLRVTAAGYKSKKVRTFFAGDRIKLKRVF